MSRRAACLGFGVVIRWQVVGGAEAVSAVDNRLSRCAALPRWAACLGFHGTPSQGNGTAASILSPACQPSWLSLFLYALHSMF